ncbi:zinc finger, CCHC-type containing protein [Tanacetum coccineum]
MTASVRSNSVFRSLFEKQKLTGPNFIDWYRQLHLLLSTEDKEHYLEHLILEAPVAPPRQQVPPAAAAAHAAWVKGQKEVAVLMLEGQSVTSYVLKMKGYIDNLERLGQPVGQNIAVSLILVSLNKDYDSFVQNYNMHDIGKTVKELHAMLKLHEDTLPKKDANPALHAIRAGRVLRNQKNKPHKAAKGGHGKDKSKMGYALNNVPFALKPKTPPPPKKYNPAKDAICHQCGCGTHICITTQGLRGSKKLKLGALSLGVISVSRLFDDGFINRFDENNVISFSKNNLVYFMAVPRDGIFEIDMSCSNTNDSSMFAISNKRAKINLDSSLLWHCRLGHISKKRIEKLQHDELLNSIDIESLGKCVLCMSGISKGSRKPTRKDRSDRGGEYMSQEFLDHLKEHGIIAHRTPPYMPQNNGVSERRNRTLVPTKKVDKTPYEIWNGQAPKMSYLKVWGCETLVKRDILTKLDKLDPRSFRCIFVGYPKETMGYSFYNPSENKVFVARNAEFFENDLIDLKAK